MYKGGHIPLECVPLFDVAYFIMLNQEAVFGSGLFNSFNFLLMLSRRVAKDFLMIIRLY